MREFGVLPIGPVELDDQEPSAEDEPPSAVDGGLELDDEASRNELPPDGGAQDASVPSATSVPANPDDMAPPDDSVGDDSVEDDSVDPDETAPTDDVTIDDPSQPPGPPQCVLGEFAFGDGCVLGP
jgi:hypothetical protein